MKTIHIARQGEYLPQIAFRHGVTVDAILADPDNARLRSLRENQGNGDLLVRGDVVVIPTRPRRPRITLQAGQHRALVVSMPRTTVHLSLAEHGVPIANAPFHVDADGSIEQGQTGPGGEVTFTVALLVRHARLVLAEHEGRSEQSYDLEVGGLDPVDTIGGQQQRLRQLGYYDGPVTGVQDERMGTAIHLFCHARAIEVDRFVETLRADYGC